MLFRSNDTATTEIYTTTDTLSLHDALPICGSLELPPAPEYLASQTVEWVRNNPNDPRAPEALHLAVHAVRYGCGAAKGASKAAFQLLHEKYPESGWAKKTKYWY